MRVVFKDVTTFVDDIIANNPDMTSIRLCSGRVRYVFRRTVRQTIIRYASDLSGDNMLKLASDAGFSVERTQAALVALGFGRTDHYPERFIKMGAAAALLMLIARRVAETSNPK